MNKEIDLTRQPLLGSPIFEKYNRDFLDGLAKFPIDLDGKKISVTNDEVWIDAIDGLCDSLLEEKPTEDQLDIIRIQIGSFLGETLIATYGGKWIWSEGQERWVVAITTNTGSVININVFRKAEERLLHGGEDGLFTFWWNTVKETISNESRYDVVQDWLSRK